MDDLEEGGKRIVFEIRTMTDLYENVSLLAAFSSLRHRIREIINLGNEEDSSLRIMHIGNSPVSYTHLDVYKRQEIVTSSTVTFASCIAAL